MANENKALELIATPDTEPIRWVDVRQQLGLAGETVPAKNLIDSTFDILRAKTYESSYKDNEPVWFCVIKPLDSAEIYTTSIGGGACVEVLNAYANSGKTNPLRVTLRWKEGGKHDGYYFFE